MHRNYDRLAPTAVRQRFATIDAFRGLGAVAIAAFHIHSYGPLPSAADQVLPAVISDAIGHGWMAVQMFLVVAGFVAAYSLRNFPFEGSSYGNFALRRAIRLGLPYWTVLALVVVLSLGAIHLFADYSLNESISGPQVVAAAVFLQDVLGYDNLSAGMWFVCIDMQFGLLLPLLLMVAVVLSGRRPKGSVRDRLALAVVFVPPALLALFGFSLDAGHEFGVHYFLHLFFLGVLTWWVLDHRMPAWALWGYAALLVAAAIGRQGLESAHVYNEEFTMALLTALSIYLLGRNGRLATTLAWPWLQYLGRVSYSLFLIHYTVSWCVTSVGYRLTGERPWFAAGWMALALLASIVAADLLYRLVERPSLRLVQKLREPG